MMPSGLVSCILIWVTRPGTRWSPNVPSVVATSGRRDRGERPGLPRFLAPQLCTRPGAFRPHGWGHLQVGAPFFLDSYYDSIEER